MQVAGRVVLWRAVLETVFGYGDERVKTKIQRVQRLWLCSCPQRLVDKSCLSGLGASGGNRFVPLFRIHLLSGSGVAAVVF